MGTPWWDPNYKPEEPKRIEGWWTIGEAPNYEINDDGVVRNKDTGKVMPHQEKPKGSGSPSRYVSLRHEGRAVVRSVAKLVETGRKYQNPPEL